MQWRGSLAALFIAMGCVSKKGMTVDLNRLILGKSYNSTKVFRTAQHVVQAILLGIVVPLLILLLIWDLTDNPNPVPAVVVIAGLVMLCFFFSYVFVVPDDLTSSATDRTLAIASKIFAYTSRGLTPEAALGASKIILSETIASAICFTDGRQVLASWGEDSAKCPAGTPVVLRTTLNVINSGEQSVFSRDASTETGGYFPRLRAGVVAPLTVRGHCVGTLELYYPRLSSIDMRQTALASGFAEILSTQLAIHELEVQKELTARAEVRALQAQINPHFLFNTLNTIASFTRTDPLRARELLREFSSFYRATLDNSGSLIPVSREVAQTKRYLTFEKARFGEDRVLATFDVSEDVEDTLVPAFVIQPIVENAVRHGMGDDDALRIDVTVHQDGEDAILIAVADNGVGMDEGTAARLFDERSARPDASSPQGGGAGVAMHNISERIHRFYGPHSYTRVESAPGKGTKVLLHLDLSESIFDIQE